MIHPATPFPTFLPLIIAVVIRKTDQRIHRDLTAAGATSATTAIPLDVHRGLRRRRLERLIVGGAVHVVSPDRYYLDEDGWARYRSGRRRRGLIAASVVLAVAGIVFVVGSVVALNKV